MKLQVANAPCSWGALEFDLDGKAAGYVQVLDEMAETGYAGTELGDWGFMPTDPVQLTGELKKRSLKLLGAFVPVNLSDPASHADGQANALRVGALLRAVGGEQAFIVLADENGKNEVRTKNAGRIHEGMGLTAAGWKIFGRGADQVARAVRDTHGLRTVFHHHCAGFVETPAEVDALMNATDPSLLGLCLDTGHYRFGGGDPMEAMEQYASRIWHVHFKDCHPEIAKDAARNGWDYFESVRRGVFCELGKGEVNFVAVVEELIRSQYNGWIVVEQDVLPGMGSPKACAAYNRDYLKSLGL